MPESPPELAPEDFYFEGPYLVFTAAYHLKRGYCCGSGCRHCPYERDQTPAAGDSASAGHSTGPSAATMDQTGET